MTGRVASLSVKPETAGEAGLPKRVVASVEFTTAGAGGDFNRYRTRQLQGDPDSAVLLLTEDILVTLREEGWPVAAGDLGENVLVSGIPASALAPGSVVRLGEVRVQLTRDCDPCTELYLLPYVGTARGPQFVRTLQGRRGWYARVLDGGPVRRGDPVQVTQA